MTVMEKLGFLLVVKDDGTYIKLDNVKVDKKVIEHYIGVAGVRNFDKKSLHLAIAKGQATTIRFSKDIIDEFNEYMKVDVSKDKMSVKATFYPASESGDALSADDIRNYYSNLDIIYGINKDVLDEMCNDRQYFKEYLVAEGTEPVQGVPARVEYNFDINLGYEKEPKLREDGTLDYNGVEIFNPVSEGDVLAKLIPGEYGEAGKDVYGEDVYPDQLPDVKIYVGNNAYMSENGMEAYAKCDGQAALRSGKIYVDNVYVVQSDVDVATGDIAFNGDIVINGNVRSGFSVKAKGNVEIYGVIEAADITAGKNIFIRDGIQGMKRAYVFAGGDVTTKFIESATVYAEGFIEANSILYSDVTSENDVLVKGKKAIIVGGTVRSQGKIECVKAGSVMGAKTNLLVGYPDNIDDVLLTYMDDIDNAKETRNEILQVIKYYKNAYRTRKITDEETVIIKNCIAKLKEITCEIEQLNRCFNRTKKLQDREDLESDMIVVSGHTYTGVKIVINGATKRLTDGVASCIFKKVDKYEIKIFSR